MKNEKLSRFNPCSDAMEYFLSQKNYKEAWENCERGDWMLWIAKKLDIDDRKLTMAKYHCAAQVLHLMKDRRSINAMAASLRYANGEINRDELAADAAAADAADAAATAAYAAAYAAYAADAADAAATAAATAAYAADAADAADAARNSSLKKSADICRKYLTEEVFKAYKKLK
jgi:hypothetical protein